MPTGTSLHRVADADSDKNDVECGVAAVDVGLYANAATYNIDADAPVAVGGADARGDTAKVPDNPLNLWGKLIE